MTTSLAFTNLQEIVCMDYDEDTYERLSDTNLHAKFLQQKSVQTKVVKARLDLGSVLVDEEKVENVLGVMMRHLIPAGTKGVVRGLEFNRIVRTMIEKNFTAPEFRLGFETYCLDVETQEKPDWWVCDKQNNKIVIGYNQIDLWSGGAQTNRANKYLSDDFHHHIPTGSSILCVICSKVNFGIKNDKKNYMFYNAFQKHRLCYTKSLVRTIRKLLMR